MTERKRRRKKKSGLKLFISVMIGFFLTASLAGGGVLYYLVKDTPSWDPEKLKNSESSIIYDKNGNEIAKIHGAENRVHVKLEDVPQVVKDAFLATEDVRFYDHGAIDFRAFGRAVVANVTDGFGSQGFSTLTQQLVKNAFLTREKTVSRKAQEIYLAYELERKYTKDEIFEMYLNRMFFGHNAHGIQAAAETYFAKDVKDLSLQEAAMLAGLMKAPNNYSPFKNPVAAKERRAHVLDNMLKYELITATQAEEAKADNFTQLNYNGNVQDRFKYPFPYFVEYVQEQLEDKFGPDKVLEGGLRVYTTLDPKIQQATEDALNNKKNFPKSNEDKNGNLQPQAAAVVIDPHTGEIRALVGGRGTDNQKRVLNRATQSKRQPGSSFKPLIAYGPALERGLSPASVVDDAPVKYGSWEPKNSGGGYGGLTTLRSAITKSVNIAAIKLVKDNKIPKSVAFAKKAGITSLGDPANMGLGIALGDQEITPLELASGYSSIANGGLHLEPTAILKISDRDGNVLEEIKPKQTVAMKATTAYMLTDMMESVVKKGTGTKAQLKSWPVAGKTGTTNDNKDIWFAGFTPALVGVVWMGHDQPTAMPHQYGGTYPAQIWKAIMTKSHDGLEPVKEFKKPDGIVYATVCRYSGKKPSPDCPSDALITDMFARGKVPTEVCDLHVQKTVCATTYQLATPNCPDTVLRSFIKKGASGVRMSVSEPTETCTMHGSGTAKTVKVCTDPTHNGKLYLANVPGKDQEGGCPDSVVRTLTPGTQAPTEQCPIPEHSLVAKPTAPESPTEPDTGTTPGPTTPTTSKPELPNNPEVWSPNVPVSPVKPKTVTLN